MSYNGKTNKETWLVDIWYMDQMPQYFADADGREVTPDMLEDAMRQHVDAFENTDDIKAGLVSDFINMCWAEVNWHELADQLNDTLEEMEG